MMNRVPSLLSSVVIGLSALPAQQEAAPTALKRQQVVVMGASVSAGFEDPTSKRADGSVNRSFKLDVVLKKVWPRPMARVFNVANLMMFRDPEAGGRRQIDAAKKLAPDLVVAIDFPFWFGYGFGKASKDGKIQEDRLAQQDKCFRLLDELKCRVLLGDYPDMSGASKRMMPGVMVPNRLTRAALNKNLLAYASKRQHVQVASLAKFVKRAVTKPQTYAYGEGQVVFPKYFLLQSDRLHATRLGIAVLTTHVLDALPGILDPKSPLLSHRATLETLVKDLGIEDQLPEKPVVKK